MTRREDPAARAWDHIAAALDVGWGGAFTDPELLVLRGLLRSYPADVVLRALEHLTISGRKFYPRPSASDIAAECNRLLGRDGDPADFDAPSYAEISLKAEGAAWDERGREAGANRVERECGAVVAAWFREGGRELIRSMNLGDPGYGGQAHDRVRRAYDEFVATQRTRAAAGRSVALGDGTPAGQPARQIGGRT